MRTERLIWGLRQSLDGDYFDREIADQIYRHIRRSGDDQLIGAIQAAPPTNPVVNEVLLRLDMDWLSEMISSNSGFPARISWPGPPEEDRDRIKREMYVYLDNVIASLPPRSRTRWTASRGDLRIIATLDFGETYVGSITVTFQRHPPYFATPIPGKVAHFIITWWIPEGEEWYPYVMVSDIHHGEMNSSEIFDAQVTSVSILDDAVGMMVEFLEKLRDTEPHWL